MNKNPLTSANFDQTIANGVTLVDLWAPWCGYCRRIAPAVEALADELDGRIRVAGVNVDDAPDVAARFGVNTITRCCCSRTAACWAGPLWDRVPRQTSGNICRPTAYCKTRRQP